MDPGAILKRWIVTGGPAMSGILQQSSGPICLDRPRRFRAISCFLNLLAGWAPVSVYNPESSWRARAAHAGQAAARSAQRRASAVRPARMNELAALKLAMPS